MSKKIKFRCAINKVMVDGEGYSKVTVEIPLTDIEAVVALTTMTGKCLLATVTPEGSDKNNEGI